MFNGYFLLVVNPPRSRHDRLSNPRISMQNINPSDPLRYEYVAEWASDQKEFMITVTIIVGGTRSC